MTVTALAKRPPSNRRTHLIGELAAIAAEEAAKTPALVSECIQVRETRERLQRETFDAGQAEGAVQQRFDSFQYQIAERRGIVEAELREGADQRIARFESALRQSREHDLKLQTVVLDFELVYIMGQPTRGRSISRISTETCRLSLAAAEKSAKALQLNEDQTADEITARMQTIFDSCRWTSQMSARRQDIANTFDLRLRPQLTEAAE